MPPPEQNPLSEMWRKKPLSRFSVFTQIQVEEIQRLTTDIKDLLEKSISGNTVDSLGFQRIYGSFWLWILGTYEITRTMSQHIQCFSETCMARIVNYKQKAAILRMPFAKQEPQGKSQPIKGELSICNTNFQTKDMAFNVGESDVWMRDLISEFDELISSITPEEILYELREAQKQSS